MPLQQFLFHFLGIVAVSCIKQMPFYERVDQAAQTLMIPSLILVWSFADPIHPLVSDIKEIIGNNSYTWSNLLYYSRRGFWQ